MKKLIKKILLSTFVIGALFFASNIVLAEGGYFVNVAVIGSSQVGKTKLINRICDGTYNEAYARTGWEKNAHGKTIEETVSGNTFKCNYYDAPGFVDPSRRDSVTIEEQIKSIAVKNANIAIIVVDPEDENYNSRDYTCSLGEAFDRYVKMVHHEKEDCITIVVLSKMDRLSREQIATAESDVQAFIQTQRKWHSEYVKVSSKENIGIDVLRQKVRDSIGHLVNSGINLPRFGNDFVVCHRSIRDCRLHGTPFPREIAESGEEGLYCSPDCRRQCEGYICDKCGRRYLSDDRGADRPNNRCPSCPKGSCEVL